MANRLALKTFRLKNFKAVRDSGEIAFTPLTVFIGNNGSGKSSIIEGLQTYQKIVTDGLDEAMNMWRGFEHIRNRATSHHHQTPIECD
jgi:AAA15 family ATPase/GTPase